LRRTTSCTLSPNSRDERRTSSLKFRKHQAELSGPTIVTIVQQCRWYLKKNIHLVRCFPHEQLHFLPEFLSHVADDTKPWRVAHPGNNLGLRTYGNNIAIM
jgi:hypothetical protein